MPKCDHALGQLDLISIDALLRKLVEDHLRWIESLSEHQQQRFVVSNYF